MTPTPNKRSGTQTKLSSRRSSSSDYKSTLSTNTYTSSVSKSPSPKEEKKVTELKIKSNVGSTSTPLNPKDEKNITGLKMRSNVGSISTTPNQKAENNISSRRISTKPSSSVERMRSKVSLASPKKENWESKTGIADIARLALLKLENQRLKIKAAKLNQELDAASEKTEVDEGIKNHERFQRRQTLCMNDGFRRIDFVLVNNVGDVAERNVAHRELFEEQLELKGLVLEEDFDTDKILRFIKIHAPWGVLTSIADIMKLNMPIAIRKDNTSSVPSIWAYISQYFDYDRELLPDLPKYYAAWFSREKQNLFLLKCRDDFFTPAQRSTMTDYLLENATFKGVNMNPEVEYVGVQSLIAEGVYLAAFPLHSGDHDQDVDDDHQEFNIRNRLYLTWSRISTLCKRQPLDYIRVYFGEYIAFYFAWVEHYTLMLVPAGLIGFCVVIYGLGYSTSDEASLREACDANGVGNFTMCPLCDACNCWKLYEGCERNKITTLIDHGLTVYFAVFMALWSVLFEKLWKREESRLQYHWHVNSYKQEEHVRSQFLAYRGNGVRLSVNPNNDRLEPRLGNLVMYYRRSGSISLALLMLILAVGCMVLLTVGRTVIYEALVKGKDVPDYLKGEITTSIASATINLVLLLLLEYVCTKLAYSLTNFELPRTQSDWENSYIIKLFIFQFLNNNVYFFHLAFIKGNFVGHPPDYNRFFGRRQEHCVLGACLADLFSQVALIMVLKLGINRLFAFITKVKATEFYKSYFNIQKDSRWEKDFTLAPIPELAVIGLYMEMVIQFAYVTLYAAAIPLAPTIALINNILQIKSDALNFTNTWRRPVAHRAGGINIWFSIVVFISRIAILTNAFIIATTSDYVKKLVYFYHFQNPDLKGFVNFTLSPFPVADFPSGVRCEDGDGRRFATCNSHGFVEYQAPYSYTRDFYIVVAYQFIFVVVYTCVVLAISWIIDYFVPDLPGEVHACVARENFLINKAILDLGLLDLDMAQSSLSDREEENRLFSDFEKIRTKESLNIEHIVKDK